MYTKKHQTPPLPPKKNIYAAPYELEVKKGGWVPPEDPQPPWGANQPLLNMMMFEGYTFSLSEYTATVVPELSSMLTEPIVLRL